MLQLYAGHVDHTALYGMMFFNDQMPSGMNAPRMYHRMSDTELVGKVNFLEVVGSRGYQCAD